MMTISHILIGGLAAATITQSSDALIVAIGAAAAILPDCDVVEAPAGKLLHVFTKIISFGQFSLPEFLARKFNHRGITHAFPIFLTWWIPLSALLIWQDYRWELPAAIGAGYFLGGCFPDMFTKSGVEFWWPLEGSRWAIPGNSDFRLRTGGRIEVCLLLILSVLATWIFWTNDRGGLSLEIGRWIGTSTGVEQVYNRYGSTNLINVQVDGVRAIDRTPVKSAFTLIQQQGMGFLVEDSQGNILKAGTEPDSQLISNRITAKQGRKASTIIKPLTITDNAIAQSLVSEYQSYPGDKIYLTGDLSVDDAEDVPAIPTSQYFPVISKSGTSVKLEACPVTTGYQYLKEAWGSGTLQIRVVHLNE